MGILGLTISGKYSEDILALANHRGNIMDTARCVYCRGEIKGSCYPVYENSEKIGYRHVHCYEIVQPLDYAIPFGNVTDEKGELD